MKAIYIKIILIAVLLGFTSLDFVQAQDGNPLQFLTSVSQSSLSNPAFHNQNEKLVIGLPLVSGAMFGWNANFSPNYIFSENFSYSFDNFYRSLGEPGDANSLVTVPLVYLSLTKNKQTFGLSISEKMLVSSNFDHEVLKFIDLGLIPYYGKEELYGPISLKTKLYREVAFTYAVQVDKKISIGVRPKLLFGKFYYDINELYLQVQTLADEQIMQVIPTGEYRISGPIDVEYDSERKKTVIKPDFTAGDYFFKFRNMGAAIDLGLSARINEQTTLSFSLSDLGFTALKYRAYDNTYTGSMDYAQDDLYQSHDPNAPNYFEPKEALLAFTDSLPFITSAEAIAKRQYELMPLKLNLSATYRLTDKMKLNFSEYLSVANGRTTSYLSAYYTVNLGTKLELSTGLNLQNTEKLLPGFGCSYTGKGAQFYLATNNIYKLVQPSKAKNLNLWFGVNFLFNTQQK
ncbi:DUF5723 family protein [uncultured Draconibacterium sp.]|uniref:DUF5723 family protein n=1 Tax=uncultured Draconibacterium sp. TaxID=1573823 RepID=UPI003261C78E